MLLRLGFFVSIILILRIRIQVLSFIVFMLPVGTEIEAEVGFWVFVLFI